MTVAIVIWPQYKVEYICSTNSFKIQDTGFFLLQKREFQFFTKLLGIQSDLVETENLPFDEFIGAQRTKASAAVLSPGDIKGIFFER